MLSAKLLDVSRHSREACAQVSILATLSVFLIPALNNSHEQVYFFELDSKYVAHPMLMFTFLTNK